MKQVSRYTVILTIFLMALTVDGQNLTNDNGTAASNYKEGLRLFESGKFAESAEKFRLSYELQPQRTTLNNLAVALVESDQLPEAVKHYRLLLTTGQGDAKTHRNLGIAYHKLGNLEAALSELRIAQKLQPDHKDLPNDIGNVLSELDRHNEAISILREAAQKQSSPAAYGNLGMAYCRAREFNKGAKVLKSALSSTESNSLLKYQLAYCLLGSGDRDQMFMLHTELKTTAPELAIALYKIIVANRVVAAQRQ